MTARDILFLHEQRAIARTLRPQQMVHIPSLVSEATPMPRCPKCNGSIILGPPQLRAGLRRCAIRTCFHEWEENDVVNGLPAAIHPANTAQLAEAALELELWGVPA